MKVKRRQEEVIGTQAMFSHVLGMVDEVIATRFPLQGMNGHQHWKVATGEYAAWNLGVS